MRLKVMTWNVENFFPAGVGAGPKTKPEYDAKLAKLKSVIEAQDPDVVALQEVGDVGHVMPRSLEDLVKALGPQKYTVAVSKHPDGRGIRVALLVRSTLHPSPQPEIVELPTEPPLVIEDLDGKTLTQMGRGAVHVRFQVGTLTVHAITAHLKSKLLEFPGGKFTTKDETLRVRVAGAALSRRTAEAAAVREAVSRLRVDASKEAVVVMGDLNDEPGAATTQLLYGPPGSQPGSGAFDIADAGDGERLFNVTGFIPADRRFSRIFQGEKELIDHILVSSNLVPTLDKTHKRHPTVDSLVDYGAGGAAGHLPSVPENPTERQGKPASDHAPVVATFEV
jgi:endonuclease/exonuclease/phosphatase family metal-dependent hydrolase